MHVLRPVATVVVAVSVLGMTACGIRIPTDPEGTLERITGGELRVGVSPSDGLVEVTGAAPGDGGTAATSAVSGPLAGLVEEFADGRDATVVWTIGSEEDLVDDLETGQLDLAIGGMTDQTPWTDRVAVTRAFDRLPGAEGHSVAMLLPMGENAFQSALETYLDGQAARDGQAPR